MHIRSEACMRTLHLGALVGLVTSSTMNATLPKGVRTMNSHEIVSRQKWEWEIITNFVACAATRLYAVKVHCCILEGKH